MKKNNSLSDLLMNELAELLNGEYQLAEALPKIIQASQSSALIVVLENHLEIAKTQAGRLQGIFINTRQGAQKVICKAIEQLIVESEYAVDNIEGRLARDAALINVLQRVAQYEILKYKTAYAHAVELNHSKIVEILNETLIEERAMNLHLNELAQYIINVQAINPFASPLYR